MHSLRQRINTRDESGFTLIELLVVLIIIGILLAIAVPSYLGFRDKAQKTAASADVREAIPSLEGFYSDQDPGTYAGVDVNTIKTKYDSGLASAITTIKGGATQYCISATVSNHTAYTVGPAGTTGAVPITVVDNTTDQCTGWTAD